MPIISKRVNKGIYHHQWQGHVSADEVLNAFEQGEIIASEDQLEKYVNIVDAHQVKTFPFKLSKLTKSFSGKELGTLVYKAPRVGQKLGEIVSSLVRLPMEFFEDWDDTIARANQILDDHQALIPEPESA